MCGIIKTKDGRKIDLIKHRGSDTPKMTLVNGYFIAHAPLPLQTKYTDLSQPIYIKSVRGAEYLLTFVGEIFNYDKDKFGSDLDFLVDIFSSHQLSDIFEYHLNEWDGFWAIILEDLDKGVTYAFTDPLGKKQLYYNYKGEICSEIKPLIEDNLFDSYYRAQVEKFGYHIGRRTPWNRVSKVTPGKVYLFEGSDLKNITTYRFNWYELPTENLFDLLLTSTEDRLRSPSVKQGMLISGGLDSSILASLNEKHIKADVDYFTIYGDEIEFVDILADYLKIPYTGIVLGKNPGPSLYDCLLINEHPVDLGSLVPQNGVLRRIKEITPEIEIVLTGDGADELFGGYRRNEIYDSQTSDIFDELTYYHLPRLDRASMANTIELRNPFLSHDLIRYALSLNWSERKGKNILKETFKDYLPAEILHRPKKPLKSTALLNHPDQYKRLVMDTFYGIDWTQK